MALEAVGIRKQCPEQTSSTTRLQPGISDDKGAEDGANSGPGSGHTDGGGPGANELGGGVNVGLGGGGGQQLAGLDERVSGDKLGQEPRRAGVRAEKS